MNDRLPSGVMVSALLRRVQNAGGSAMVLAKGDPHSGVILVVALERGRNPRVLERGIGPEGDAALVPVGQHLTDEHAITDYWRRRRARDPDLWVIELDIALAERFAAETIIGN